MASPREIMDKPFLPYPLMQRYSTETPEAERAYLEAYNNEAKNAYRVERQRRINEKLAVCPELTLSVSGPSELPLHGSSYFTATLKYESMPGYSSDNHSEDEAIVIELDTSPLAASAVRLGQYHIYTSADFCDENKVRFTNICYCPRRPRGPNGRFLELPDSTWQYSISEEDGWVEMRPGDEVSRQLELRVDINSGWEKNLEVGGPYWLRYVPKWAAGCPKGIYTWKFGTLEEWKGKLCDTRREGSWIALPVESAEALEFWII